MKINTGEEEVKVEFSLEKQAWRSDFIQEFESLTNALVSALRSEGYHFSDIKIK